MNDTRIARKATDRNAPRTGSIQRAIPRAVLVGTMVFLIAAAKVNSQDQRISRTSASQGDGALAPVVTPGYQYLEEPGYGYSNGWEGALSADCGMGCPPTWRTRVEGMMMNREGDAGATLSSGFFLNDFDYTEGGRVTLDRKYDCTLGWEVIYTGLFQWEEGGSSPPAAAGTLNTSLNPDGVNLSAFNGANLHQQLHRSRLQSVEVLQKWWGWDVLTTSAGLRWISVQEDFSFRSVDAGNVDVGFFSIETNNHLIGPELGVDMLFPIGRWSIDTSLKGGLFVNIADSNTFLSNAGVVQFANSAEDAEFAAMVEYGTYLRYAVGPRVTLRAGYEFLWIYGLGVAIEQVRNPMHSGTGRSFDGTGDTFYHGGTAGVEIIW